VTVDVSDRARGLAPRARVIGRVALWAVVALLLFRGFGAIVSPPETINSTAEATGAGRVVDDRVATVAVRVARDYFSDPRGVARHGVSKKVSDSAVAQAEVTGAESVGPGESVVTVESELSSGRVLALAVPIRHADGAVSVLGAPYLVAQPQVTFDPEPGAPLSGPDAEEITKLVTRFLRAYASSARSGDLVYFVAPGFEVTPLGGFDLANDPAIGQLGDEETERTVTASARFKDKATGTVYPLRYRLDLVKRKRWFVADVQGVI